MSHVHASGPHGPDTHGSGAHGPGDDNADGHTEHGHDLAAMMTQEFWDERYGSAEAIWSGNPNPRLVEYAADLPPGTALDVGSGEGADAIWLASRGWQVTAIDISPVALDRAARQAAAAGPEIADRIRWQQADLASADPAAAPLSGKQHFDLVSAQFMHLPRPVLRSVHQRLAGAVRPGGDLLIVGHHPSDLETSMGRPNLPDMFYTAAEIAAELDPDQWRIVVAEAPGRQAPDPDGRMITIRDAVLKAVRLR